MPLTAAQRDRLQNYRKKGDRGREPVYVGRESLFRLVADNADAVANGDVEGRTICIAGPPGIGKTAFLATLAERAPGGDWGGPPMACIHISPDELRSPAHVLAEIAWQLPKHWQPPLEKLKKPLRSIGAANVSFSAIAGFSLSASFESGSPETRRMPWRLLPSALRKLPSGAVLCLLVDEAHTLANTPGMERNVLLQSLHMGPPPMGEAAPPPPVFAVLAGHTHTPSVLAPSISQRYARGNLRYMRNLSWDESISYVLGTLRHLQGSGSDPGRETLARWIADECGGFPHHLRNAMHSVAEGMLQADSLRLADLDGAFVANDLREQREQYYEARAEGTIARIAPQLAARFRRWSRSGGQVHEAQGERELSSLLQELPRDVRDRMGREGILDGRDLMDQMILRGVLMTDMPSGCRCPIDSMIGWMEKGTHAGRTPFPELTGRDEAPRFAGPSP